MIQETTSNFTQDIDTAGFSIEMNSSMFTMLTKNVYNNVILAPIREWATNAIDACLEANVAVNYDVNVPTVSNPVFSVRDYGAGLAEEDITGLFSVLGASTKRSSDKYNGTFGIGRMSGLAYATSFTVDSYHNNTHYTYLISIDKGIPSSVKLSEKATTLPNGLQLSLAVKVEDISNFRKEMSSFYKYVQDKPNLSEELDIDGTKDILISGSNWYIQKSDNNYYNEKHLVMGNVPYQLDTYDLPSNIVINAPIGSVSITPGRESLTYDDKTKAYIKQQVKTIEEEVARDIQNKVALIDSSYEQAKALDTYLRKFYSIVSNTKLPIPKHFSHRYGSILLDAPTLEVFQLAEFNGSSCRKSNNFYLANLNDKFIIQDIPKGFVDVINSLPIEQVGNSVVIKPVSASLSAIETMVPKAEEWLEELGIPSEDIYKLSDYYTAPEKSTKVKLPGLPDGTFQSYSFLLNGEDSIAVGKYDTLNADTDVEHLYFEMHGSSPLAEPTLIRASLALKQLGVTHLPIIGVPKKAIKAVEASPAFIPAEKYLKTQAAKAKPFKIYSDKAKTFLSECYDPYYEGDNIPADLQALYTRAENYTKHTFNLSTFNEAVKHYSITTDTCPNEEDFKNIKDKYKLLTYIIECWTKKERQNHIYNYFELENIKHENNTTN